MSRRLAVRSPSDPLPWAFGVVVAALVIIGLTTVVVRESVSADSAHAAIEGTTLVGDATAVQLEGATRPAEATVRTVAGAIGVDGTILGDPDRMLEELGRLMDGQSTIAAITVAAEDGSEAELDRRQPGFVFRTIAADGTTDVTVLDETLEPTEPLGEAPRRARPERAWLDEARWSTGVVWSDPEQVPEVGRTVVHASMAARDAAGTTVAVVSVRLDAEVFSRLLLSAPATSYGDASVVGENGVPLAGVPGLGLPDDAATEQASRGTVAMGDVVTYQRPVGDSLPWVLTVAVDAEQVLPAIASLDHTMLLYTVVIVVVTLIMSLLLWALRRPAGEVSVRARTDALTGLSNRHHFEVRGNDVLQAASRRGTVVAVAVFDLDNFKSINDGAGHELGDDALRAVADGLARASGPRDVVGRLGGDEFAAVLWLAADDDSATAVERLRTSAHMTLERAVGDRFEVGVSAGWVDTTAGEYRLPTLVRAADDAMMAGKRTTKGVAYEGSHA
ncbi:diguanylate cyclase [Demequina sp. SYSU T00192]|uniref:Diguanylate cyclase n=1 Tax=Demequina litoralis TaxID=3051660 RepID=A0ABT8GB84_9MICO|nr:diguanylate cyclase [Demequina sp. SYSU T00192]MDN4476227.1 diguanylate cyclase [Demequina sp. SYSU T00192]